ncbi:DUF3152 domain-containing protein [Saccharopolyspora rectivirgula]|uniref:DUF3152 domain-containing protein n=1 Tax=Saccharopolyspora rectivirgula TaxID=28042 RepID=UPI000411FCB6|nr:DUF3152 domain-containing protein [Saccharopolyspora rectivirgula]
MASSPSPPESGEEFTDESPSSATRTEPLAAAWDPVGEQLAPEEGAEPERRGRLSRYGWRMYAVPLLVVISALAVLQTVSPVGGGSAASEHSAEFAEEEPEEQQPVVTEAPPGQVFDENMFSADLPPGGEIPETGARTYEVLPGSTDVIGSGKLYRYTVEVEVGVELAEGNDSFAHLVDATLADPRSWTNPKAGGIALQRVDSSGPSPDFRVILVSQQTAREVCGYSSGVPYDSSCRQGEMVYINAARWVRGAVAYQGDIGNYRRYAINHEVGHVFGNGHVACPKQGGLAPVMMQQTFSVSNNELNELNEIADQGTYIPANGFVCKPNPWPFPLADSGA